jgi:hypothetical protein
MNFSIICNNPLLPDSQTFVYKPDGVFYAIDTAGQQQPAKPGSRFLLGFCLQNKTYIVETIQPVKVMTLEREPDGKKWRICLGNDAALAGLFSLDLINFSDPLTKDQVTIKRAAHWWRSYLMKKNGEHLIASN